MLGSSFFDRRVGLGCMGYSWGYSFPGQLDDKLSVRSIQESYDLGVRHFDTSDMYGVGHNESLLSRALKGYDDVFIATKGGIVVDSIDPLSMHLNGNPGYLSSAIDNSLQRLGRDYVDLYYLHRTDPEVSIEDSVEALVSAQKAGKVKSIGLSEVTTDELKRALTVGKIEVVQSELSVWTRDPLKNDDSGDSILSLCSQHDIKFVAFSPLGRGYLTGKLDVSTLREGDFRSWMPRFSDDARQRNQIIVDMLSDIANSHSVEASQIALAWIFSQGENIYAIPGSRKAEHVKLNLESENISLTEEEIEAINRIPLPQEGRY